MDWDLSDHVFCPRHVGMCLVGLAVEPSGRCRVGCRRARITGDSSSANHLPGWGSQVLNIGSSTGAAGWI